MELVFNTALKNYQAKEEQKKQDIEIAKQRTKDLKALEGQSPEIDWHSSWTYRYKGYFQRFGTQDSGVSFALISDASAGNYYFVKDGQIQKGEMRFLGRDQTGKWLIYDFTDPFGNGRISFEDRGSEVSGAICFPPDFQKCGGFKGTRQ